MQPQAGMAMQRLIHTPLGRAVAQVLIVWLVLQPLWEVSWASAREDAPPLGGRFFCISLY